jgi:hypothetical protein
MFETLIFFLLQYAAPVLFNIFITKAIVMYSIRTFEEKYFYAKINLALVFTFLCEPMGRREIFHTFSLLVEI